MRALPLLLLLTPIPTIADVYERQPDIDVIHYEISIELADNTDLIRGTTRVHVMMQKDRQSSMWLDLEDMEVEQLSVAGRDRPFTHKDGKLSFDYDRPYRRHEIALIEIRYRGRPNGTGLLIGRNNYGRPVFFAENWPDNAHHWFPSIDHPSDKATVDFAVTAPEKYDVVANGQLVETRSLLDGRKLTRWSEGVPIPTYCIVLGVAEFSIKHAGTVLGIPLTFYAYPQDAAAAAKVFARTNLIVQYFNDLIGPYPYQKLAQVQSTTCIGGMENSNAIFYSERTFQLEPLREGAVPHEIAHQWFGDSVTETDWDHLWLSEGFATYFSALFYEHLEGADALKSRMAAAAQRVKRFHETRPAPIIDPDLTDLHRKLNAFNYQKGAWALHMLRKILGDSRFFSGIRRYYNLYAGKNASTEDFQRVMENVEGDSLDTFFRQWFYQPGWPEYKVTWRWIEDAAEVELIFEQSQTTGLFDMPVEIAFPLENGSELRTVRVWRRRHTFRMGLPGRPSSVEIDPDNWILKSVTVSPASDER